MADCFFRTAHFEPWFQDSYDRFTSVIYIIKVLFLKGDALYGPTNTGATIVFKWNARVIPRKNNGHVRDYKGYIYILRTVSGGKRVAVFSN